MPELPEAETIVRGLRRPLVGRSLRRVEVIREDLLGTSARTFCESLSNRAVREVSRRGKNVVVSLHDPAADGDLARVLVINLGMSGRLIHRSREDLELGGDKGPSSHPGALFHLDDDSLLVYDDVRRFGRLRLMTAKQHGLWSSTLGPEPLSPGFTSSALRRGLSSSRSPIRSWLLDQRRIAGVGNIYANEALAGARIHPRLPSVQLSKTEAARLYRALRRVLRAAIDAKGTTLRDYRTAEGRQGSYRGALKVYGREGDPCHRCREMIERVNFGGRSAFFCPRCQPFDSSQPLPREVA